MSQKDQLLFHFTNIQNLKGIMSNGILCANLIGEKNYINSGNQEIKERRKSIFITQQHTVADFVPFYFADHSPMLYTQWKNQRINQEDIIYIVIRLATIVNSGIPFYFSDRNAAKIGANFYSNINELNKLDWESINARMWNNTDSNPDRLEKKMAEFLVLHKVPYELILGFATYSDKAKESVAKILGQGTDKLVATRTAWYY